MGRSDTGIEEQSGERAILPWEHFRVPPFPQIAIRVLQLVNHEDVPIRQLSDLISSEPVFSSEILSIANSALYARRAPVTSILHAIALLGTQSLRGLCLTVAMRAYFSKSLHHSSLMTIWRHNLACAFIAEHLATVGLVDRDDAYTAGVMHDIGRFALAAIRPDEYALLLETNCGSANDTLPRERELFGFDHCEAGHHLIADWGLPSELEAVVSLHHCNRQKNEHWQMADVINLSCRMADTVGFAVSPQAEITAYEDLLEEIPVRERHLFPTVVGDFASEIACKINLIESV